MMIKATRATHHGMLDIKVDTLLVWIYANLDGIVDSPAKNQRIEVRLYHKILPLNWNQNVE